MASTDGLNTIPPGDPRYAGTEATTGTDETAGQADAEPRHSDPGDPCTHPWCVAVAEANATATPEERESAQRFGVSVHVLRQIRDDARAPLLARVAQLEEELEDSDSELVAACTDRDAFVEERDKARAELAEVTRQRDDLAAKLEAVDALSPANAHLRKLRDELDQQRTALIEALQLEAIEQRQRAEKAEAERDELLIVNAGLNRQVADHRAAELAMRDERDEARAKVDGGEHPCLPLVVIAEAFGGGLEVRCGNCGTYEPIGSGGEMDLAELRAWLDGHCEPVTDDGSGT